MTAQAPASLRPGSDLTTAKQAPRSPPRGQEPTGATAAAGEPALPRAAYTSTRSMPPSLALATYSGIQSSPRMRLAISTTM